MAQCPAHHDRTPSLSVKQAPDKVLLNCFAGCLAEEVVAALDLTLADLFDDGGGGYSTNGSPASNNGSAPSNFHKGGIIFDAPERIPAIWGRDHDVLWSEGEPLIIAGPPGVGKSTLAQQIALARCGIPADLNVLGYPVAPGEGRTLYVAADRPEQALRSMRRMVVDPRDRELIDLMLVIWKVPFDALADREQMVARIKQEGIGTVVFDSIKDVAGDVADGKVGAEFNKTLQLLVSAGIEVAALHHNRKGQEGNRKPKRLDDLYGSQWIAAGAGSVVYLYGEAGDLEVTMLHLKQPDNVVGPLKVIHDHGTGTSTVKDVGAEEREPFRSACVAVLRNTSPLGRDKLIEMVKADHGISGRTQTLRDWLTTLANDPESGFDSTPDGYVPTLRPQNQGHTGATPPPGYGPTALPLRGDGATPGPPAGATPATEEQMRAMGIDPIPERED